jgi:hypothetical protein
MRLIVESTSEAIGISEKLVKICNSVIHNSPQLGDIEQTSYENFLCSIRDSIEVEKPKKDGDQ